MESRRSEGTRCLVGEGPLLVPELQRATASAPTNRQPLLQLSDVDDDGSGQRPDESEFRSVNRVGTEGSSEISTS